MKASDVPEIQWAYRDNNQKVVKQFNEGQAGEFIETPYSEINRETLEDFRLYERTEDGKLREFFRLNLKPFQHLIYRKRNFVTVGPNGEERKLVYIVGYRYDKNKVVLCYIDPITSNVEVGQNENDIELLNFE